MSQKEAQRSLPARNQQAFRHNEPNSGEYTNNSDQSMESEKVHHPPVWVAAVPPTLLLVFLFLAVQQFGDETINGPAQIALFAAGTVAAVLSLVYGASWKQLENTVLGVMRDVMQPILILLLIGALIGIWILSGVVPALIFWGLHLIHPHFFLPATAIVSSIVSLATGSSWSTAGTIGVAFMGMSQAMGIDPAITAGAVVSGAYFGDKLSPFSETTNLASSLAQTDLFVHVQHMLYTTLPAMLIALVLYTLLGFSDNMETQPSSAQLLQKEITQHFTITPWLLIVPALTIGLIAMRTPAIPSILAGIVSASVMFLVLSSWFPPAAGLPPEAKGVSAAVRSLGTGYFVETGNKQLDGLLLRGGMASMLGTVWLILSAMFFAGMMEGGGMVMSISRVIMRKMKSRGDLIAGTMLTAIAVNLLAAEQFLSLVVSGRIFRHEYRKHGLDSRNLSRAMEDSGTLTSALIPWNTCGAFMGATLGVSALDYFSYSFLNYLTPMISLVYAYSGKTIVPIQKEPST